MAEFINSLPQTIEVGESVTFSDTLINPCRKVIHREGSGVFTLKGGRFTLAFSANVSGATPATEVALAFAVNGETLGYSRMASTTVVADDFNNVAKVIQIDIPNCCCTSLSIRNVGTTPITVDDASLVMRREEIV